MSFPDEPLFESPRDEPRIEGNNVQEDLGARIKRLVKSQPFAVLSTQGQGQPYGSLVAYAMSDDLTYATFATPRATRKFRLLCECDHVAMVIDDRSEFPDELMKIQAVTVTGRAVLLDHHDTEFDRWADLLIKRHPYMAHFVRAATCGLFRVEIVRYFHVCHFQEVRQWIPK